MQAERMNELLTGPLWHPLMPLHITRLALALAFVVNATGTAGESALEQYCRDRQEQDERNDWQG